MNPETFEGFLEQKNKEKEEFRLKKEIPVEAVKDYINKVIGYSFFHYINNSLQIITGSAALLQKNIEKNYSKDDQKKYLASLDEVTKNSNEIVHRLEKELETDLREKKEFPVQDYIAIAQGYTHFLEQSIEILEKTKSERVQRMKTALGEISTAIETFHNIVENPEEIYNTTLKIYPQQKVIQHYISIPEIETK